MKRIVFSWPEGKAGALTTSWDDGTVHDRRLIEILNRHGLKGTWNLNAGLLATSPDGGEPRNRIARAEVNALYAGHEVACHSCTHPSLTLIPEEAILAEMTADRRALEELVGYPVKGMALPNGAYDRRVLQRLRDCGIVHSRTTCSHSAFRLPEDFLEWHPTCHHKADLAALWRTFLESRAPEKLFYLWGHSYEFDRDKNWDHIEAFARLAGPEANVWHATNMAVYDYVRAWRGLWCGLDVTCVRNVAALPLWFRVDGELRRCDPNQSLAV